jgi:PII-like signaling protein
MSEGRRLKLTAYLGERDRSASGLVGDGLMEECERLGIETSALFRGVAGFGLRHHLRTDRLLTLSEDLPLQLVAIDEAARVEALAEAARGLWGAGLLTLERAHLPGEGEPLGAVAAGASGEVKLTIHLGRRDRVGGRPAFAWICDLLRARGVAGATAQLGVDGTVAGERRRGRFFSGNAGVPTVVVAVGGHEAVGSALPELRAALGPRPIAVERIVVCRRDGRALAPLRDGAQAGAGHWRRLTVYASESALHGAHPIHLELVRRLRQAGARGACAVRGIWGFHGDHAPHGDSLRVLRRRAPIVTSVIDEPDRIEDVYPLVEEVTSRHGLVTSEVVPRVSLATIAAG